MDEIQLPPSSRCGAFPSDLARRLCPGDLDALEGRLQYHFHQPELLLQALTHASAVAEHGSLQSNQRLEYLGDAVLQLLTARYLFDTYPDLPEGPLTRLRAASVSEPALARLARQLDLGGCLILGRGADRSGGRDRDSILSDAMEAVIAAVYLDGGLAAVSDSVMAFFAQAIDEAEQGRRDTAAKTRLQEALQQTGPVSIVYDTVGEEGPPHAKVFRVQVVVNGSPLAQGLGASKRSAQQQAASAALQTLTQTKE